MSDNLMRWHNPDDYADTDSIAVKHLTAPLDLKYAAKLLQRNAVEFVIPLPDAVEEYVEMDAVGILYIPDADTVGLSDTDAV